MLLTDNFEYVGFWKRVLAALIDAVIGFAFLPVTIPLQRFCFAHRTIIPGVVYSIVWTAFWIWLVVKFGATPGKMVIKARIVNSNGEYLSWYKAFLRYLFPWLLVAVNSYFKQWYAMNNMPAETSVNSLLEIGHAIRQYGEPFSTIGRFLGLIFYIDILVILFNKRKRAVHDFIAGSFVVTKNSLNQ